jgi:cadmium resistance protein CadD (predicted permease)
MIIAPYLFWSFVIVLSCAFLGFILLSFVPNDWLARWLGDSPIVSRPTQ